MNRLTEKIDKNLYACDGEGAFQDYKIYKCDNTIQKYKPPTFDYHRFSEFLQWKNIQMRLKRLDNLLEGKIIDNEFTDEEVLSEMKQAYGGGEINDQDENFLQIFAQFKEIKSKEIEKWIKEEEDVKNELVTRDELIYFYNESCPNNFSSKEIENFELVSSKNSKIEPFIIISKPKSFDEKFQLLEKKKLISIKDEKIKLDKCIQFIVNKYPTGINLCQFIAEFNLEFEQLSQKVKSFSTLLKLFDGKSIWIQSFEDDPTKKLIFPKYCQTYIQKPEMIFRKIEHLLRIILCANDGILRLDKAFLFFEQIFSLSLKEIVQKWNFNSFVQFTTYLLSISKFSSDVVLIRKAKKLGVNNEFVFLAKITSENTYLLENSDYEILNVKKNTSFQTQTKKLSIVESLVKLKIPENYFKLEDYIIKSQCESIEERQECICVLVHYNSPSDFYVILKSDWPEFKEIQNKMRTFYENKSQEHIPVNENLFKYGLYLSAAVNNDYFRAEYIRKLDQNRGHQVNLFDIGKIENLKIEQLKYLEKKFGLLRKMAIHCCLYNVSSGAKNNLGRSDIWSDQMRDFGHKLMHTVNNKIVILPLMKVLFKIYNKEQDVWQIKGGSQKIEDFGKSIMDYLKCNPQAKVSLKDLPSSSSSLVDNLISFGQSQRKNNNSKQSALSNNKSIETRRPYNLLNPKYDVSFTPKDDDFPAL